MRLWTGTPYWLLRDGLGDWPAEPPADCDVAIVGAGITGALLADSLAAAGLTVTVVDRRIPAAGSTAACTGILTYEVDVELCDLAERIGEARAVRSYLACADGVRNLAALAKTLPDCGFAWKPSLYLAARRRDTSRLQMEVAMRERHGIFAEFVRAREVEAVYGIESHGALKTSLTAVIDAVKFTRALLARATRAGAVICGDTTVLEWTSDKNSAVLTTTRGELRAGHVIFATGYETPPAFRDDLVSLHSSYALATRPLSGAAPLAADCILWNTNRPYFYCRPAEGNRIVYGGHDLPFESPALRDRLLSGRLHKLERDLAALFPMLRLDTEFAWGGTFGETPDGLPYIGSHANIPRALFALGYGGNGIVFSAIAAEMLRDVILGMGDENLDLFAFDRS